MGEVDQWGTMRPDFPLPGFDEFMDNGSKKRRNPIEDIGNLQGIDHCNDEA